MYMSLGVGGSFEQISSNDKIRDKNNWEESWSLGPGIRPYLSRPKVAKKDP